MANGSGDGLLDGDRYLVVLDVNVFLDVAELVGEPFTWDKFEDLLNVCATEPVPHPSDARYDSLRAIGYLRRGELADGMPVEVWTSNHIDLLVAVKAAQPTDAEDERDRGLGWSDGSAQALVDDLVTEVVTASNGRTVGDMKIAFESPPLSHEDGCVYATAKDAGYAGIFYEKWCLTRDRDFLNAALMGLIERRRPFDWVRKHQAVSRAESFKKLLGR